MLDEGQFRTPAEKSVWKIAAAGLCFVSDDSKGIARKRRGKAFQYLMPSGAPLKNQAELARIRKLAIPPAWRTSGSALSPTGISRRRSGRPRSQTVPLSPEWNRVRDEAKYDHTIAFARFCGASAIPSRRTWPPGSRARKGARHRGPSARDDADPCRQPMSTPARTSPTA